jgi:hypothetical protein
VRTTDVGLDEWRSRDRIGVNYHVRRDVSSLDPVAIRDLYDQFPDWRRASTRPDLHAHELSEFATRVTVGDYVYAVESESQRVLVGVVSGPYRYENSDASYPHQRRVDWTELITRADLRALFGALPSRFACSALCQLGPSRSPHRRPGVRPATGTRAVSSSSSSDRRPRAGHRKIVLSQKGFDQGAGGAANLILPSGEMVVLPIPEPGSGITYADLRTPSGRPMLSVMREHGITRFGSDDEAHLDPDLRRNAIRRRGEWRPAFGQRGPAQSTLDRAAVEPGDLFLFYGWFRFVGGPPFEFPSRAGIHALWGWLEVGERLEASAAASDPALRHHPHVRTSYPGRNIVYTAAAESSWHPTGQGAGAFSWSPTLALTKAGASQRSTWSLPGSLHPSQARSSFDSEDWGSSGSTVDFRWRRRQEAVFEANDHTADWVGRLMREGAR